MTSLMRTSNDDDIAVKSKATVSGDETVYQDNHITLDKPSGSTTIIINNRSTTSSGQSSSSSTSGDNTVATVPADISVGAHQQPVQPHIKYPSYAGTKRRAFNSDWFNKYRWLEYSQRGILLTVMHAGYLLFLLRNQMHLRTQDSEIGSMPQAKMEVSLNMT